jgi:hypothetical protein
LFDIVSLRGSSSRRFEGVKSEPFCHPELRAMPQWVVQRNLQIIEKTGESSTSLGMTDEAEQTCLT